MGSRSGSVHESSDLGFLPTRQSIDPLFTHPSKPRPIHPTQRRLIAPCLTESGRVDVRKGVTLIHGRADPSHASKQADRDGPTSLLRHQTTHLGSADGSNTQPQQETLIVRGVYERGSCSNRRRGCGRLAVLWPISRLQQTFCDEPPVPGPGRPGTPDLRLPTIALGCPGCVLLRVRAPQAWMFLMRLKRLPEPTFPDADLVTGPAV